MNALLKIVCTMLNDRLTACSQSHHLINKEQIGFQKHSRIADHKLTLKALVNIYNTDKKGKKLYGCYLAVSLILKRRLTQYGMRHYFANSKIKNKKIITKKNK